jgi:DNA-binding Lrp family transcriptional regulator
MDDRTGLPSLERTPATRGAPVFDGTDLARLDRRIVRRLQGGLPLTARPYDAVADVLGVTPALVRARVDAMLADGRIRRIGVVPNH